MNRNVIRSPKRAVLLRCVSRALISISKAIWWYVTEYLQRHQFYTICISDCSQCRTQQPARSRTPVLNGHALRRQVEFKLATALHGNAVAVSFREMNASYCVRLRSCDDFRLCRELNLTWVTGHSPLLGPASLRWWMYALGVC